MNCDCRGLVGHLTLELIGGAEYRTVPVGSFEANPFGLYNVQGNVSEWEADCRKPNCNGAPDDGSPWLQHNCTDHVHLGSGAFNFSPNTRAASRFLWEAIWFSSRTNNCSADEFGKCSRVNTDFNT